MKTKKYLLMLISICIGSSLVLLFPFNATGFLVHQEFNNKIFNGDRIEVVDPQPETMSRWTLVAKVRPSAESAPGSSKTILTNDRSGWNNDVLFGISPEVTGISDAGRWAIIHQDEANQIRTIACAENEPIEADRWYHVAASSDGEYLRLYVDGQLVAGPVQKSGASLMFRGIKSYIGASLSSHRYFDGEIAYVQIYPIALSDMAISELSDISDGIQKNLGIVTGLYTRSVTIGIDGTVYVIDSSSGDKGVYEIVDFDSESENNKSYSYTGPSTLNDIEFFCGSDPESCWWYGTTLADGFRVFRWKEWSDFQTENWEEIGDLSTCYHGYFLTKLSDRLFVACYEGTTNIYEIKEAGSSNPYLEVYVPKEIDNDITLDLVTSIDFCNENEIITDLGLDRFVYRRIGETDWQVSPTDVVDGQHSITCGLADDNKRYFVADSENHRIISFNDLAELTIYSETQYIVAEDETAAYMCRPHDLEYNPVDGYFYGVTAPYNTECNDTYLFRFKDIYPGGEVEEGGFLDLKNLGNAFWYINPVHQEFDDTIFDGDRKEVVLPHPITGLYPTMSRWTLVAKVRPSAESASGSSKTILTNDRSGWNNDVLFGISPEGTGISAAGRWAIIHQDEANRVRTIACAENEPIEADRWYHVAASSDGEYLRLYVDGQLVAGPVQKSGASLMFHGIQSYIGAGLSSHRYFDGEIAYVQIYPIALSDDNIADLLEEPPVAICMDKTVVADENCLGDANIDNGSYDSDGEIVAMIQSPPGPYSLGTTEVTLTVTDDQWLSEQCTATVEVKDTTPPDITLTLSPNVLWPPNNKMRDVLVDGSVTDMCGDVTLTFSVDDEYGELEPEITVFGETIELMASRKGKDKDGRVYTITVEAVDSSGNSATDSVPVLVPHDMGEKKK